MSNLYQVKHELWLDILYGSFAINDSEIKERLFDFSIMAFLQLKWIGSSILEDNGNYNYDSTKNLLKRPGNFDNFNHVMEEIKKGPTY